MNRYIITLSYQEHAEDDEMVIRLAKQFVREMDINNDNKATVVEIVHRGW